MTNINQTLQQIYSAETDKRFLLANPDYFLDRLAAVYQPEMKQDCQLMERAIRNGAGKIIQQFLDQGALPTAEETRVFQKKLQERAGFTGVEAKTIVDHLYAMVGFTSIQPKPMQNPCSKKLWSIWLHPLLTLAYVIYIGGSFLSMANGMNSNNLNTVWNDGLALLVVGSMIRAQFALIAISLIFSLVGYFGKKPWGFLTAAIIQSVGIIAGISVELLQPMFAVYIAIMFTVGYIAYAKLKKHQKGM